MKRRIFATVAALAAAPALAQTPDMAAAAKWEKVKVVHYEVVGEIADMQVQIPADDADLYADIVERVKLSFDWDRQDLTFVGAPSFQNLPTEVSNLSGMGPGCPTGHLNGPYEHFDIVEIKQGAPGDYVELAGKRLHPDAMVAEACGSSLRLHKGATEAASENIGPPDPVMLAYAGMMKDGPFKVSPDGKSIIMTALNNKWVWTYTPTVK